MATCSSCNSFILFGGEKFEAHRFCNKKCLVDGRLLIEASKVNIFDIDVLANKIHKDVCPMCKKNHGVEAHKSYSVASFVFYTRHQTSKHICCRSCALKKQSLDFTGSLLLGWWGFPWGIIMTPIQLIRNIIAMTFPPKFDTPSDDLQISARLILAQQNLDQSKLN